MSVKKTEKKKNGDEENRTLQEDIKLIKDIVEKTLAQEVGVGLNPWRRL